MIFDIPVWSVVFIGMLIGDLTTGGKRPVDILV